MEFDCCGIEEDVKQDGNGGDLKSGYGFVVKTSAQSGNVIPPMFIFPRVRYHEHFIRGATVGSVGYSSRSGWSNQQAFVQFLQHMIRHTHCSPSNPLLLILDNHDSHVTLEAVSLAKENGIVLLTLPPHTTHNLQLLDKCVFGPLKTFFNSAVDSWMRTHPGKTITIYDIPALVNTAFMSAMSRRNILSGFESTGIFPYDRTKFTDDDFEPSELQSASRTNSDYNSQDSSGYRSPETIFPLPKTPARKAKQKRKRVRTRILTDTPEKEELEREVSQRQNKKAKVKKQEASKPARKKIPEVSSSDESTGNVLNDSSDASLDLTSDEEDLTLNVGDFVVAKFAGEKKPHHYIGLVEKLDHIELEARFLQRSRTTHGSEKMPTFTFKEKDEAVIPREDVVKKLPQPFSVGGTSGRKRQLVFSCNLKQWNIELIPV
ncbi:uncharacterized protein LOC119495270 isoform X3 [Scomber scombrus]|uniref:Uncharacterized protein LOC119495270 isoform X3 n=1 Tax=Scomber scombrus TaxID=13677 RepID=A0AAV1NQ29_SCOSC